MFVIHQSSGEKGKGNGERAEKEITRCFKERNRNCSDTHSQSFENGIRQSSTSACLSLANSC